MPAFYLVLLVLERERKYGVAVLHGVSALGIIRLERIVNGVKGFGRRKCVCIVLVTKSNLICWTLERSTMFEWHSDVVEGCISTWFTAGANGDCRRL